MTSNRWVSVLKMYLNGGRKDDYVDEPVGYRKVLEESDVEDLIRILSDLSRAAEESAMEQVLLEVQRDFGCGGLSDGLYGEYAAEVARRWAAR